MRNYFSFSGRASREEYFKFRLFNTCVKFISLFFLILLISEIQAYFVIVLFPDSNINWHDLPNITWLLLLLLFFVMLRLILSMRLYALSIRRLHDIDKSGKWYLLPLISRQIYNLLWILFIGFTLLGFTIMFEQIAAADNISPSIVAQGISQALCCPPLFNVEMFLNGGSKMWLYIAIFPIGVIYYSANFAITILLSFKSKSEENIFGTRLLPEKPRHSFIYLSSLFAEIIYTIFFICFVLINWYRTIWLFNDISASESISFEVIYPSLTLSPGLGVFFCITLGLIILNTLFFKFYFRYSK